jgi:(1->4)-alpha-D-glucan 1-alpha-D-glucosylmutase
VLKLAAPGVADFYQGTELWDFSLVDPDNRRPVDFAARQRLLDSISPLVADIEAGRPVRPAIGDLLAAWPDGRIKLLVAHRGLAFRRRHTDLLQHGSYIPLAADGPAADHVVAFARRDASGTLLAVVPRLVAGFVTDATGIVPPRIWRDTQLTLPDDPDRRSFRNVFTGERLDNGAGDRAGLSVARVFDTMPVALLWSEAAGRDLPEDPSS